MRQSALLSGECARPVISYFVPLGALNVIRNQLSASTWPGSHARPSNVRSSPHPRGRRCVCLTGSLLLSTGSA